MTQRKKIKILFDLDGTVTSIETLPLIARAFHVEEKITELTARTVRGDVPFVDSFIQRVQILGCLSVKKIADLLYTIPIYEKIASFIQEHAENCVIVTGNISNWCEKLISRFHCQYYASSAIVQNDTIQKLSIILKKEDIVKLYQQEGYKVVFVGDGNNDVEALRNADIAIASGLTHYPARSVLTVADYVVFEEQTLCRLLNQLL